MRMLAASVAFLISASHSPMTAQPARGTRPNIIFIMTDDHAAHAIGAYGSKVNQTPNLDRLAKEGALLTSVFGPKAAG